MLTEAANWLSIKIGTLNAENAPAKQINANPCHVNGSFADSDAVRQLAEKCDLITVEIEYVNTDVLKDLARGIKTGNDWRNVKGKLQQKVHLQDRKIHIAAFDTLEEQCDIDDLEKIGEQLGYPFMLKSRTEAYDGRGNHSVKCSADIPGALAALQSRPPCAEKAWS
ncbi:MAG: hypothetical protein Q9166_006138 [cf. Caloplaca sp. 2 TL-2023]